MKTFKALGLSLLTGAYIMFLYWLSGGNFDRGIDLVFAAILASVVPIYIFFMLAYKD